jgi:transcriptional regulator with XRE-family HTH domain
MNIKILLGKRIKELRKRKGLTQEKVAEFVGIDTGSLSNIETGKYYPTAENLEKIIKILETSPEDLFVIEHLQTETDLVSEINKMLNAHPDKIQDVYKMLKGLFN